MREHDRGSRHLIKAIDPCLPRSFRDNNTLSLADLIRARVLVTIMLCGISSIVFSLLVLAISHLVSGQDFGNAMTIALICGVALILNYLFFYKSGRLDASAILFSLTFFLATIISTIITGGFDSPVKIMLVCTPVVAFLIGGRQEGMYNAALSYVVGIVLLILHVYDFPMMQIMPETVLPYLHGIVWLVAMVLIVVCLYVYDVLLEDVRDTIANVDEHTESAT
jgi:hypothetical protein